MELVKVAVGTEHATNNCGMLKVIEYTSFRKVTVKFIASGYITTTIVRYIRQGKVRDPNAISVAGVGYIGEGAYKAYINRKPTKAYTIWLSMLTRCYGSNQKTYKNCTVCADWHNFQNYAAWYEKHCITGFDVDKDLLSDSQNKVYSPATCQFISRGDNVEASLAKTYTFNSPQGNEVAIHNLRKFCKENNLDSSCMVRVANGERKQHKGWTYV